MPQAGTRRFDGGIMRKSVEYTYNAKGLGSPRAQEAKSDHLLGLDRVERVS